MVLKVPWQASQGKLCPRTYPRFLHTIGAFALQHQSFQEALQPDFLAELRSCRDAKALSDGKHVHLRIIKRGLERLVSVENLLLQVYGNCGCLEDARDLFARMLQRNVFSWTFIIRAYAGHGRVKEAFQLFEEMQLEGISPDKIVYISILSACASQTARDEGMKLHAHIVSTAFELDIVLGAALVNMYRRCGSLEEAQSTFLKLPERDVFLHNVMIAIYVQNGQENYVLELFYRLLQEGLLPDKVTFISTISACSAMRGLAAGRQMHARIVASGLKTDRSVSNALVSMYNKGGSLTDATSMFNKMVDRDVISWNAMIAAYTQNGQSNNALHLFEGMLHNKIQPNEVTFVCSLSACACQAALVKGKQLHACIMDHGFESNLDVGNALVNMYGKSGSLKDARMVFDKMTVKDVVSWTTVITAHAENRQILDAFQLFTEMELEGVVPDKVTLVSIISAFTGRSLQMHSELVATGLDDMTEDPLVSMSDKSEGLDIARNIFERIPVRSALLWNAMITAYAQNGQGKAALELFDQMHSEGVMPDKFIFASIISACTSQGTLGEGKCMHSSIVGYGFELDTVVGNALINMYGKCGSIDDAQKVFDKMPEHDAVSWTAIIEAYAQHGHGQNALQLFEQMQSEAVMPDRVTFISIFSACASHAALVRGKQLHTRTKGSTIDREVVVGNAIVNMYGKCGSLQVAHTTFDKMSIRNVVSWNVMIAAYAQNGRGKEALQLFRQMQHGTLVPNKVTFVSVLCACSHDGLLDDGWQYFSSMQQDYGIAPTVEHYNSMIDLLGRAGWLDEAENLVSKMPFQPTVVTWMTLLGASRYQADLERGERAANIVFELDPHNAAPYVMLANIYGAAGRVDDAMQIIKMMKEKGLTKELEGSIIEVNGNVHVIFFRCSDAPTEGLYLC